MFKVTGLHLHFSSVTSDLIRALAEAQDSFPLGPMLNTDFYENWDTGDSGTCFTLTLTESNAHLTRNCSFQ